jgi:4-amino-4-deoxy-L-arabinose transferase-like glycosyltransferase
VASNPEQTAASGAGLIARLGLAGAPADGVFNRRLIALFLLLYAASFALFYPRIPTNHDEANYIRQTQLLLEGRSSVEQADAFTGEMTEVVGATYPLGTALFTAPWVALFGWRGAFLTGLIALLGAVLITARWIREQGQPAAFALILLGFPPALVIGRLVMSDVLSAAWVALGLLCFWRGRTRASGWWLASGFIAGSSLLLRASNPVIFAPFFFGTVVRREWRNAWLVVGGLLGVAMRPLSMQLYFGNALYERSAYHFAPDTLDERLPLYLVALLVFVPGGLLLSLLYRGARRWEVVTSVGSFFLLYLFQTFSTIETSFAKRSILALRYLIPILPVMAFAMSEAAPRLSGQWLAGADDTRRRRRERLVSAFLATWLVCVGIGVVAVHPAFSLWSASQAAIREEIARHVPDDAVLVTNVWGTKKFVNFIDRPIEVVNTALVAPDRIPELLARHPEVYLVVLDRTDSEWWLEETRKNADYLAALTTPLELLSDIEPTDTDRLRIWRVGGGAQRD